MPFVHIYWLASVIQEKWNNFLQEAYIPEVKKQQPPQWKVIQKWF